MAPPPPIPAKPAATAAGPALDPLLQALPDAVLIVDHTRRIVAANDAAEELLGLPRETLAGGYLDELAGPARDRFVERAWARFRARGHDEGEFVIFLPGGRRLPVHYRVATVGDVHVCVLRPTGASESFHRMRRIEQDNARLVRRAEEDAQRTMRLQRMTEALSEPLSPEMVADVALRTALETSGAAFGIVAVRTDDDRLLPLGAVGAADLKDAPAGASVPADLRGADALGEALPLGAAVRDGRPLLVSTLDEQRRRFPAFDPDGRVGTRALASLPFIVGGRTIGAMAIFFHDEHPFGGYEHRLFGAGSDARGPAMTAASAAESAAPLPPASTSRSSLSFLATIARLAAHALERGRLHRREEAARRELQEALSSREQSLALLDTLLGNAPIGLGFVDRDLHVVRYNRALGALGGAATGDAADATPAPAPATDTPAPAARTAGELLAPAADAVEQACRQVLETGAPLIDLELGSEHSEAPGERRHWLASFYPVRAGTTRADTPSRPVGVGLVVLDITDRKRAEETHAFFADATRVLASSLDHEATLGALARLAVPFLADWCVVDIVENGVVRQVALAHVDPQKLAIASELRRRYPARASSPNSIVEIARSRASALYGDITDAELRATARDADHLRLLRELNLKSAITVPLVSGGRGFGVLTLVSAESNRRFGPADVEIAEELARRAAAAADNARLYRDAQDAVRVREDFLSIAGHELKTPLTALKLQLHGIGRLGRRGDPITREAVMSRSESGIRQTERLEKLIGQMLDVSRITAGRLKLDVEPVDLTGAVDEVVARFRDEIARIGARVELALPPAGAVVGQWDRLRLDQVITNLVSNAVKYGRGQPIEISARAAPDGEAELVVRDHGIGIAPESHSRIFGRFERAVSERNYGGFGLGLWIVRQIVETHGGAISLSSVPGEGSTFTVRLPIVPRPPKTEERR